MIRRYKSLLSILLFCLLILLFGVPPEKAMAGTKAAKDALNGAMDQENNYVYEVQYKNASLRVCLSAHT